MCSVIHLGTMKNGCKYCTSLILGRRDETSSRSNFSLCLLLKCLLRFCVGPHSFLRLYLRVMHMHALTRRHRHNLKLFGLFTAFSISFKVIILASIYPFISVAFTLNSNLSFFNWVSKLIIDLLSVILASSVLIFGLRCNSKDLWNTNLVHLPP